MKVATLLRGDDQGNPGLILDGASAVGKTHQVFEWLKSGQPLAYLLLVKSDQRERRAHTGVDNSR
jgi:hypothetical protein